MEAGNSNRDGSTGRLVAVGLFLASIPATSSAVDYGYGLGYRAEHSDNMALTSTNPRNDWLNVAQAQFALQDVTSPNVTARIYSLLEYDDYLHNTFNDQTLFFLNSAATWFIRPQRLSWTAEDYYGQIPINPFAVNTPNNMQNVNVFSTGPNLFLRMDPLNSVELGARYGNYHAGAQNTNSDRASGFVGWFYQFSPITVFSLNYQGQNADYTSNVVSSRYTRNDLFFRMVTRRPDVALITDLGNTWLHQSETANISGVYARVLASKQLTEASSLSFTAMSTTTDTADTILAAEGTAAVTSGTIVGTDIYRLKHVDVTYTHGRAYGTDRIRLFSERLNYFTAPLDQELTGARIDLGNRLTGTLFGSVYGSYIRTKYDATSVVNRDGQEGVRFAYEMRPDWFLGLEGRRTRRLSNAPDTAYSEDRVILSITFYSNPALVTAGSGAPSLIERDPVERDLLYSR